MFDQRVGFTVGDLFNLVKNTTMSGTIFVAVVLIFVYFWYRMWEKKFESKKEEKKQLFIESSIRDTVDNKMNAYTGTIEKKVKETLNNEVETRLKDFINEEIDRSNKKYNTVLFEEVQKMTTSLSTIREQYISRQEYFLSKKSQDDVSTALNNLAREVSEIKGKFSAMCNTDEK